MPLTLVIGNSGSGKTTFINDVNDLHSCTYIRQYHKVRPNVQVSKIPNFDVSKLPYWSIYEKEGKCASIQVGGMIGGVFVPGLSGGQRKILLFELISQRTASQSGLLITLDEPFAGVTDDFIPYIVERLHELSQRHNIVVVSNDHIDTLKGMADNTIVVSSLDRSVVRVNGQEKVSREKVIMALSSGEQYTYKASEAELRFFLNTELLHNWEVLGFIGFSVFLACLFVTAFWNSSETSDVLVLIAADVVAFFAVNPYLLSLPEWRIHMKEEAEALLHASTRLNSLMKTTLAVLLILVNSALQFGVVHLALDGAFGGFYYWWAMLIDGWFLTSSYIYFSIYTDMSLLSVTTFSTIPFLFELFFSTTYSPGAGVEGLKDLRYLFPRFYFWCRVPSVQDQMEGCPPDEWNILYLTLSGFLGVFLFLVGKAALSLWRRTKKTRSKADQNAMQNDDDLKALQIELNESSSGTPHSSISGDGDQHV